MNFNFLPFFGVVLVIATLFLANPATLTKGDLSRHTALKELNPYFFNQDLDFKDKCANFLVAKSVYDACESRQFVTPRSCHDESSEMDNYAIWCFSYLAYLKNDSSWCENIGYDDDACYKSFALAYNDATACDKIWGDISAVECYKELALQMNDPFLCFNIEEWYRVNLLKFDVDNPEKVEEISQPRIKECMNYTGFNEEEFAKKVEDILNG